MGNRLIQILASLAQRRALRGLDVICETQHQISTRKLEQYLHQIDNELSGHAHYLRIEYDALTSKVATLEAERAEQWSLRREAEAKVDTQAAIIAELQDENAKLRAELERRVPDGYRWYLVPKEDTDAFNAACSAANDAYLGGVGPCGVFIAGYRAMLAAAPSAPKADDPVKVQLLEALEFYANGNHILLADEDAWDTCSGEPMNWLHDDAGTASVEDGSLAKAAIAAARKGE